MKWMLQYLRGTSDYCITYNNGFELVCGYVDSDFADDLDKRRSTSRYVFTLAGGPFSWMSKHYKTLLLYPLQKYNMSSFHMLGKTHFG